MAPICCSSISTSRWWWISRMESPSKRNQALASTLMGLPEASTVPPGVSSGPLWVPSQWIFWATMSSPAIALRIVPAASGSARFQPSSSSK
jgi:hypothetical protein